MRHKSIPNQLFINNRNAFTAKMKPGSVAIFVSNYQSHRNGDQVYWPYRQNSELYYLTGIAQEDTFLILFPDAPLPELREILFLKETSDLIAVWEGYKHTAEEAEQLSGIKQIKWSHNFETSFKAVMKYAENVYLNLNENDRSTPENSTHEQDFVRKLQNLYPLHQYQRSAPILEYIRSRKSGYEIDAIKEALSITKSGLLRALKYIGPGKHEFEVQAEIAHELTLKRSNGFSFEPIMAGGANACVLHYVSNNDVLKDGDLMLLDFGADYAYYAADLSRTVPVNGKYSPRQRQVYETVLGVLKEAKKLLVPGKTLNDYNLESAKIMEQALIHLGLISLDDVRNQNPDKPAYKKYFPHGTGHFLGIDVHDIGARYGVLDEGMLITCEPGIYIPEEGIGIRIENDIVITSSGPRDLMEELNFPITCDEIEAAMAK